MKDLQSKSFNIKIISITLFVIVLLFGLSFTNKITKKDYEFETTATIINKNGLNDMTETEKAEYFNNFWENVYYEKNIKPSNEKFYRRFNRAYAAWMGRVRTDEDKAILEASKPHLLSALFLDYTPDNFNSDIEEWAENGDLDNIYLNDENYAYQVCDNKGEDDANCSSNDPEDFDYNPTNIVQAILQTIAKAVKVAQKYLDDRDTIRALGRHLFVYQPMCTITRTTEDGKTETFTYEYGKKYTFDEILDIFAQASLFQSVYSGFPEYQDCSGRWAGEKGVESTTFGFYDTVDLCSFYKHLVESDYFENHAHFKDDFAAIRKSVKTDQEYLIEKSKLKVGLARQIIDIVDISNEDDPVYDTNVTAASGGIVDYSLSDKLYISISNSRTDSSGYVIKDGSYPIDQYVEGVLDAEVLGAFYSTSESEDAIYRALQANAIAIRTYALKVTKEGTKSISNSTANQVFTDKFLISDSPKYKAVRNAALSTTQQVLTENGQLIMSEYSSFSKNVNYHCEGDLCYTSYQKIGAKNSGTLHTVIAKKSWGLAGGHNRGMSQWGSLYLAANGYSYQQILANFYAENVKIANYDYSYKNTDRTTEGEYGEKEAMLVCQLFTSSGYSDIRDLLGDNTTLEIPLRITSTSYQSSHGYNNIGKTNGLSFNRDKAFSGGYLPACEWDPTTTALLYNCYHNEHGYITNEENYKKNDAGQYLDLNGNVTKNPDERVLLDVSETRTEVYLPNAIVWQWAVNTLGFNIPSEGGWNAHGYRTASAGLYPSYVFGNLPKDVVYPVKTNAKDGTAKSTTEKGEKKPCNEGYIEKGGTECCSIKNKQETGEDECYPVQYETIVNIVYDTKTVADKNDMGDQEQKSTRYDAMLSGDRESMEMDDVLYTGLTSDAVVAFYEDKSNVFDADHIDTNLYMYVKDSTVIDSNLKDYFSSTAENIIQANAGYGGYFRDAGIEIVKAAPSKADPNGGYVNVTKFLEDHGFVNNGGMANKTYSSVESHHWDIACDYYTNKPRDEKTNLSDMDLAKLSQDYCCDGLFNVTPGYDNYSYKTTKNNAEVTLYNSGTSYLKYSSALGGYFSDAWKIGFCAGTIEGKALVAKACGIALTTQPECYTQCYTVVPKNYKGKTIVIGGTTYKANENGSPAIDGTKEASNCKYDVTLFGGSATYKTKELTEAEKEEVKKYIMGKSSNVIYIDMINGVTTMSVPRMAIIPSVTYDQGKATERKVGYCSCAQLLSASGGGRNATE